LIRQFDAGHRYNDDYEDENTKKAYEEFKKIKDLYVEDEPEEDLDHGKQVLPAE
jgi:hypothetical protein